MMNDPYANWRQRLKGEPLPIHEGEPECGLWRVKNPQHVPFAWDSEYADMALAFP